MGLFVDAELDPAVPFQSFSFVVQTKGFVLDNRVMDT